MSKTPDILWPALRQYRHNTDNSPSVDQPAEGFVSAFAYEETIAVVRGLEQRIVELEAENAKLELMWSNASHGQGLAAHKITELREAVFAMRDMINVRERRIAELEGEG